MKRIIYTLLGIMLTTGAWAQSTLQEQIDAVTDGRTIQLSGDYEGQLVVKASSNLVLDLNGHNITATGTAIINNGTLTIKDTGSNGKIVSTGNVGVAAGNNSTTTIESGIIESVEGAVITSTSVGATITINGGTFSASDNAVVSGNGTNRSGAPNTIIINGGTFNGQIKSAGYIACGIYAPWKDVFNVSGGTFNITGGCGIIARGGDVNISGGTFNCTGTGEGWVGDTKVQLPCAAVVFDSKAEYPGFSESSNIEVTGGSFTAEVTPVAVVKTGDVDSHIDVAGGSYSAALPEEVCKDGFIPKDNGDGTFGVKEGSYLAQIGASKYETLAAAVAAATADQTVQLLADINGTVENTNANNFILDLNGKTWVSDATSTFKNNGGTVTIIDGTGDGTIKNTANAEDMGIAVWARTGSIIIENGTFINQSNYEATLYVGTTTDNLSSKQPTITVNGGTVKNEASGFYVHNPKLQPITLNIHNDIYNGNAYQAIVIKGGTFFGNDPSVGDDSQVNEPQPNNKNSNFVSSELHATMKEGKFVIEEGGYVAQVGYLKYVTITEALDVATASQTITLLADAEIATIDMLGGKTLEKNGHKLYVTTFALTDATAFSVPVEFTAKTATYTRTMPAGTKYGTVCVPFALTSNTNGTPQLYTFGSISSEKLTVTEATNVAAATPVVFYTESSEAVFSSNDVVIDPSATPSTTGTLIGTFTQQTITENLTSIYYINGDAFHQAKASLTVPAYRAYISYTPAPSAAKPSVLSLFVDDSEATGVASAVADKATAESLCDINGRMLAAPQKGINILKLTNGKTVKLIIK